jgi:hypothetical protein
LHSAFNPHSVGLDPQGIHAEDQRAATVIERIDQELQVVVVLNVVSVGQSRIDLTVRLEGPNSEVDGIRRVPDQHLRAVVGWETVRGLILGKTTQDRGGAPDVLLEQPVYDDLGFDSWRRYVELVQNALVDVGRWRD